MDLIWSERSWQDYLYWQKTDKRMVKKINTLLKEISRNPFDGIGKPEPLRHEMQGSWSRRINDEHRLVYRVSETAVSIVSCRYHYE